MSETIDEADGAQISKDMANEDLRRSGRSIRANALPINASINSTSTNSLPAASRAMPLIALLTDGDLSSEERDELREHLKAQPGLLQSCVDQAVLHAMLEWRYARPSDEGGKTPFPTETIMPAPSQTFTVQGELTLQPAGGGSGKMRLIPSRRQAQLPGLPHRAERRRWPLVAVGFAACAVLVAAGLLWSHWSEKRQLVDPFVGPPAGMAADTPHVEPTLPAVYVDFDNLSAIGGTLRMQLDPKKVACVPEGLVYPNLACNRGALKIDGSVDQNLWLDLDEDIVVPVDRNNGSTARVRADRGPNVAWPRGQRMGTPGTTMYMSFLIRAEQPVASGFCGLGFYYGHYQNFFIGKARGVPGFSYDFDAKRKTLLSADPKNLDSKPIPLDTKTHLIVTRIDFRQVEDRFSVYFDPNPSADEPKQANATGLGKIALDRIRISAGRGADSVGAAVWYLDDIRLADRYAVVVPSTSTPAQQEKN